MTVLFAPLPPDFDQLALAARIKRGNGIGNDPDLRSAGERTYAAFEAVNFAPLLPHAARQALGSGTEETPTPRLRDWRHIPYALWLSGGRGLHTQTALVDRYLTQTLHETVRSRRPMRWGRSMLHTYWQHFDLDNPVLLKLAKAAGTFFKQPKVIQSLQDGEAAGLVRLVTELDMFDPQLGPTNIARDILSLPPHISLVQWQSQHSLSDGFWLSPFCRQAFMHALSEPQDVRSSLAFVRRMCEWAVHAPDTDVRRFRYPLCRDDFAYNLLSPWFERSPPPELQNALLSELLRTLGDPRHDHAGWLGVRREAIKTASRWMTARTLDAFFDILKHTQDDIGSYRRQFWQAYSQGGHISEAWVALGTDAAVQLARIDPAGELSYAQILGKIAPNQSVLMLRMGDLLLCDWSHQGRLRAISASSRQAPKLYLPQYELFELRFATPLDFNQGQDQDPGLLHTGSKQGAWQDTARQFIAQHLNIHLPLADLMPADQRTA